MSDILAGLAAGHLISTDGGAAQRGAAADAGMALVREEARTIKQEIEAHNWRERAKILSAGRKVRKMSEETLLQALQQENANHPLASGGVIDRIGDLAFEREMDILDADPEAYADEIAKRIPMGIGGKSDEKRAARLAPINQPFLDQMPPDIAILTEEQRAARIKKAEWSWFSSIPAWASIERARIAAVEQADVDWVKSEEARIAATKQADAEWEAELAVKLAAYNAERDAARAGVGPGNPVLEGAGPKG